MMFDRLGDRDYDSFEPNEHSYLKEKIGFAKFGPPHLESGYDDDQKKSIDETYKVIVTHSNQFSKWRNYIVISFIYNCLEPLPQEKLERSKKFSDYNPYTDITPIPIFVIRKCEGSINPCRIFVDCENRVYSSWEDYLSNNKLHKCMMVVPKDGRYSGDEHGNVLLQRHASPSCSIRYTLLQHADIATSMAGIASGAVLLTAAIPAITVAPIILSVASITGVGVGLYSILRSGLKIYDRITHGESMNFTNSEARGAYLNIIAGSLGFVGAGATSAMSQLAADGVQIGEGARVVVNVLNVANTGMSAAALANATYELYDTWREDGTISTLSIIQLGSSVLFFGNAVYSFRTSNTIINEAQNNALRNHQESLRSNRHRKTFNKLVKETIRQNSGDAQAGRAEVISTISKISNRDDVLAVLTRNNRQFNRDGVRFAVKNGQITLNGVVVDIIAMGTMSKNQRTQFLIDLPPIPKLDAAKLRSSLNKTTQIYDNLQPEYLLTFAKYFTVTVQIKTVLEHACRIMLNYEEDIQEKIFKLLGLLLQQLHLHEVNILKMVRDYVSNENPIIVCLTYTIRFLKIKMNEDEARYQTDSDYYATLRDLDIEKRATFWFRKVVDSFISNEVNKTLLNELVAFVMSELTQRMYDHCNNERVLAVRRSMSTESVIRTSCSICGGYYYSN